MAKKKDNIIITRKAMYGIALAIAIAAILISKMKPEPLLLFGIGIFAGILIARGYFEK